MCVKTIANFGTELHICLLTKNCFDCFRKCNKLCFFFFTEVLDSSSFLKYLDSSSV